MFRNKYEELRGGTTRNVVIHACSIEYLRYCCPEGLARNVHLMNLRRNRWRKSMGERMCAETAVDQRFERDNEVGVDGVVYRIQQQ